MVDLRTRMIAAAMTWWLNMIFIVVRYYIVAVGVIRTRHLISRKPYTIDFHAHRAQFRSLIYSSDVSCHNLTRMNRTTLDALCAMLDNIGGLKPTKNMLIDEQVAMFAHILSHHVKNRVVQASFKRSGESVSRHFNRVLNAMMRLGGELLRTPEPVPSDSTDSRWKFFKNCLGALDGTHIKIRVPMDVKVRYRNRKGEIATNVLGVCTQDGQFIFVLPGWEGSAADGRVLRDAITRHGFRVPLGCYYLVDGGYTNCEGFLAPYRGQRYHLNEWHRRPSNAREFFNMKHSSARNIIERCFGMLKQRWAILRSPSYYPVRTHNQIIIACCLLHNLLMRREPRDLFDDDTLLNPTVDTDHIPLIEPTNAFTQWRDNLANEMYTEFRNRRR